MNVRTTILLLLVTVGGGIAWWKWDERRLTEWTESASGRADASNSRRILPWLDAKSLQRVEIHNASGSFSLERDQAGRWALPGNWPTRQAEAQELIDLIVGLETRFAPIPLGSESANLKEYGLDPSQKPVSVFVQANESARLVIGESNAPSTGPSARPTYVRVNDRPEVFRLGPNLLSVLRRPREFYQRKQLFPDVDRVRFLESRSESSFAPGPESGSGSVAIPRAQQIRVQGPAGQLVFRFKTPARPTSDPRVTTNTTTALLAENWEIVEPVVDQADPETLKNLLTTIPNLWVESFSPSVSPKLFASVGCLAPLAHWTTVLLAVRTLVEPTDGPMALAIMGLNPPEYLVTVTSASGDSTTLQIGRVSRISERLGTPPPSRPGMPPLPPLPVREEFRYARLQGQPIVFEVKLEKVQDLFPSLATIRDAKLARFQTSDAQEVTIHHGMETIVLRKEKDAKSNTKWRIVQPLQAIAEDSKVTELLDKLAGLEARDTDIVDQASPQSTGLEQPTVRVALRLEEELPAPVAGGEKVKRQRTVEMVFGSVEKESKKVHVQVAGRKRINRVEEAAVTLASRSAIAYRGRRIMDFDASQVARIEIQRKTESFVLQQDKSEWSLVAPVKAAVDRIKASDLAFDLGRLEATEYVDDNPSPERLKEYGLDQPHIIVRIALNDSSTPALGLLVGKQKDASNEYFAKQIDGASVFAIRKDFHDRLDQDSLSFRVKQLWSLTADDVTSLSIQRGADRMELKKDGGSWSVAHPFAAPASVAEIQPILDGLVALRVEGYEAHSTDKLADFGLNEPQLLMSFTALERSGDTASPARQRTFMIGKAVPGKPEVYAKLEDDGAVFRVSDALLRNASKSAYDLLDRRILAVDRRKISMLDRSGSQAWILQRDGESWKMTAGGTSFPADAPTMDSTLQLLESLQAQKVVAYGPNVNLEQFGLQSPADTLKIMFSAAAGEANSQSVLRFGKEAEGGGRYVAVDDNQAVFVIPPAVARALLRAHLDYADKSLLKLNGSAIQKIQRLMKNNDLELTKSAGWKITKPVEQTADEALLDELTRTFSEWRADRVVAYQPKDLTPFGLVEPAAILFIEVLENGKATQKKILVGSPVDPAKPDGERHVMVESSPVVGVMDSVTAKRLMAGPLAFRDRLLIRRLAEPDKIVLERGERKATFVKSQGTWRMAEPLAADAEHADLEDFVNALFRLRADEFVAEKPTPEQNKEFGLDKPSAVWQFFTGDKENLKLILGKKDSTNQRVYATLSGNDLVFLLTPAVTSKATSEYRKRSVFASFDAAQVEALTVADESVELVLQKKDGKWQISGKPEIHVKQEVVTDILAVFANLKVHEFLQDRGAKKEIFGLAPPKRRIKASTVTGQTVEIHLGNLQGGTQRVYASAPGRDDVFTLSENDSSKLLSEVK
jgi:hypothetical protein